MYNWRLMLNVCVCIEALQKVQMALQCFGCWTRVDRLRNHVCQFMCVLAHSWNPNCTVPVVLHEKNERRQLVSLIEFEIE